MFEEIDRLGADELGVGNALSRRADFDFFRIVPAGGYTTGRTAAERTDVGEGDIEPEEIWRDFFPYRPHNLGREPNRQALAKITNRVQAALDRGGYEGAIWMEGSPSTEETSYWLNLLIDTTVPIVGCQSPDTPHGTIAPTGDRHLVDAVRYLVAGDWKDDRGRNRAGVVVINSGQLIYAREAQKADARPGAFIATGDHGGIVGTAFEPGDPHLTYLPTYRHTWHSDVRISVLPSEVTGIRGEDGRAVPVKVRVKDDAGQLLGDAIPSVGFFKQARFRRSGVGTSPEEEVEILAQIDDNLRNHPLAGIVVEGTSPHG
jgi:hypothetical protein